MCELFYVAYCSVDEPLLDDIISWDVGKAKCDGQEDVMNKTGYDWSGD